MGKGGAKISSSLAKFRVRAPHSKFAGKLPSSPAKLSAGLQSRLGPKVCSGKAYVILFLISLVSLGGLLDLIS